MRWLTFGILGVVFIVMQSTLAPRMEILGARPDFLLVLVVFFGMHGKLPDVAVGAWLLGFVADLMSIERLGLMAFSYMLTALLVASVAPVARCWSRKTSIASSNRRRRR